MDIGFYQNLGERTPYIANRTSTLFVGDTHDTLVRLALDDIYNGKNIVFFGDVEEILNKIPKNRQPKTQIIKPDLQPFALNILKDKHPKLPNVLLDALKGIWGYDRTATPVLDMYLRAGIMTMMEQGKSFLDLKRYLTDSKRQYPKDKNLKDFWYDFDELSHKDKRHEVASTLNKLWAFLLDKDIRDCIGQKKNHIDLNGIVLIDLDENTLPLGAFILSHLYLTGDTTVYLEDAHLYGSFVKRLIYRLPVMFSVRYLDQFHRDTIPSILGVEQIVSFRVGADDYRRMASLMNIAPNDTSPVELTDRAIMARNGKSVELDMPSNDYPLTQQETKIIERCYSQCTAPVEKLRV